EADMLIADIAVDLSTGYQGCDRIDDHDIDAAAPDQNLSDFQGLFAKVRLGNEQVIGIDAQPFGITGVQGMLGIDEGDIPSPSLGLGNNVQGERSLARRLRAVDLGDPAAGETADAEGQI